jgi:hypothetical protein
MHAGHSGRQQVEFSEDSDHCGFCKAIAIQASQGWEFRISRAMDEGIYCAGSEVKCGTKCRGLNKRISDC